MTLCGSNWKARREHKISALQACRRSAFSPSFQHHTLLLVATPHAINVTLYEKSNVSITHDIVPIAGILIGTFVMLVSPSLPAKTVPEFIAYAKANPGKVNMTSSGAGNLSHLAGELFKMMTGIDLVHVPYKGAVPAHAGLMGGDVHIMFDAMTSALPQIQSGRLRALAVTTTTRSKALPDIPTVAEFVQGYEVRGWLGVLALQGARRAKSSTGLTQINAVLADPAIRVRLADLGSEPLAGSPADFGHFITAETEKWGKVIRVANIKAE
jgi:tripartite-type tricarboxylate transporter receptor subunit TctC